MRLRLLFAVSIGLCLFVSAPGWTLAARPPEHSVAVDFWSNLRPLWISLSQTDVRRHPSPLETTEASPKPPTKHGSCVDPDGKPILLCIPLLGGGR